MNPIIDNIYKERPNYCHAIETNSAVELKETIAVLSSEFDNEGYTPENIIDFFDSISIYSLSDENEDEIYNVNVKDFVWSLYN